MSESVADVAPASASRWSILHPTDFSAGSQRAFVHALRIALPQAPPTVPVGPHDGEGSLMLVHVGGRSDAHWTDYPGIRDTLARWGMLPQQASRKRVVELGLKPSKIRLEGTDPVQGVLERARKARADLLVLATHRRGALTRWLRPSVAESIARSAETPTLLLGARARGFVDRRTGQVRLSRILLPIAEDPRPERAIDEALRLAGRLGVSGVSLRLLTVGTPVEVRVPDGPWTVEACHRDEGDVVAAIVEEARRSDLVVMTSLGRNSASDLVMGSTTERVLHRVSVPVLMIPALR